jgi:hypothetical protein
MEGTKDMNIKKVMAGSLAALTAGATITLGLLALVLQIM